MKNFTIKPASSIKNFVAQTKMVAQKETNNLLKMKGGDPVASCYAVIVPKIA
jgi:hypothetical protein